ncbi:hydrolase or metal-binding protein, partial [Acinetobacter baumannii]
ESDELGTFIFRTTGFNSIRTLAARLSYYHAASNGLLSCLPLQLTLRGESTTQSYRTPVYYVDLTLREGVNLQQAIQMAKDIDQQGKQSGFNQSALDHTARQGFANAQFEV